MVIIQVVVDMAAAAAAATEVCVCLHMCMLGYGDDSGGSKVFVCMYMMCKCFDQACEYRDYDV